MTQKHKTLRRKARQATAYSRFLRAEKRKAKARRIVIDPRHAPSFYTLPMVMKQAIVERFA